MTRSQEVHERVNALVEGGVDRSDAFKQVSEQLGIQVNSVRGSYYSYARGATGDSKGRPRRRETTTETALQDARASLERSLANIDREVVVAKERSDEGKAEYESLKASAAERKKAIAARLEALK